MIDIGTVCTYRGQGSGRAPPSATPGPRVVISGTRLDGTKFSLHLIYPKVVVDAPSLSGMHLAMDVGLLLYAEALQHCRDRASPRPPQPAELDIFIIRLLNIYKTNPRSFAQTTVVDLSVYKVYGMFRVVGGCKISYPKVTNPITGEETFRKKFGQPLKLMIRHQDGSIQHSTLTTNNPEQRQQWIDTTVTAHNNRAQSEVGKTSAYGDLISYSSNSYTARTVSRMEAYIWGDGNSTPARRLCSGPTKEILVSKLHVMVWAIAPQGPSAHKQRPRRDRLRTGAKVECRTVQPRLLHDINCNYLSLEEIGRQEFVHCWECDYTGANDTADRDPSAITTMMSDGSGGQGVFCFCCWIMYWFDIEQELVKPLNGLRSFRSAGSERQFVGDIVSHAEVLGAPFCVLSAMTGAGKTMYIAMLIEHTSTLTSMWRWPGCQTSWMVIVYRRSLADAYYSTLESKGGCWHELHIVCPRTRCCLIS